MADGLHALRRRYQTGKDGLLTTGRWGLSPLVLEMFFMW